MHLVKTVLSALWCLFDILIKISTTINRACIIYYFIASFIYNNLLIENKLVLRPQNEMDDGEETKHMYVILNTQLTFESVKLEINIHSIQTTEKSTSVIHCGRPRPLHPANTWRNRYNSKILLKRDVYLERHMQLHQLLWEVFFYYHSNWTKGSRTTFSYHNPHPTELWVKFT